jgi:hypothetical protein
MPKNRPSVEHFVQDVLGCTCPPEVFDRILVSSETCPDLPVDLAVEVGGRLLIHVSLDRGLDDLAHDLARIILEGMRKRDDSGFNRFRYVVATDAPEAAEKALVPLFSALPFLDEKTHLHIIPAENIACLIDAP